MLHSYGSVLIARHAATLKAVRARAGEQRIHRYRVQVKRLRTLLRLLEEHAPDATPPKAVMKRLKSVFHAAAIPREAQVSVRTLRSLKGVSARHRASYAKRLSLQEHKGRKLLVARLEAVRERDAKRILAHIEQATQGSHLAAEQASANRYVNAEMAAARKLIRQGPPEEVLHEVRKHLKNVWHTLRLLNEADGLPARRRQLLERLAPLQEGLGEWHDIHVLLADLKKWKGNGGAKKAVREAATKRLERRHVNVVKEVEEVLGVKGST
jgi:CHAD domain-containing protein